MAGGMPGVGAKGKHTPKSQVINDSVKGARWVALRCGGTDIVTYTVNGSLIV